MPPAFVALGCIGVAYAWAATWPRQPYICESADDMRRQGYTLTDLTDPDAPMVECDPKKFATIVREIQAEACAEAFRQSRPTSDTCICGEHVPQ